MTSGPDGKPSRETDAVELSRGEVRSRALAGVLYVTASGIGNLLVGFVGNLVLARMLTPDDFGVVAIGLTAVILSGALADGGLGSGMVRRPEPPTRAELRTLNGIQLAIAIGIFLPIAGIALGFGETGAVTALMISSIPILALQTPGRIMLARTMRYDRQSAIEFSSQATFYLVAVVTVALGAGVWGFAIGTLARAGVGTILTAVLSIGLVVPSLRGWRGFGPLVRFGLKFQATWLTIVLREQGVTAVTAAIGGLNLLGLWSLAQRLLQLPVLAFTSLYTVGFPAMSNLLARGETAGPVILRICRRASIAATLVLPAFAAASPELVPSLFGDAWRDAAIVIPFIALSTLILGSISVGASSYLNAAGSPGVPAWGAAAFGVIWIGLTAALLPFLGLAAIGIGNLCGALVEASVLDRATRRRTGVSPYRPVLTPLAIALTGGTTGWLVCTVGPAGFATAVTAAAVALGLSLAGLFLTCLADLKDTLRVVSVAFGAVLSRVHHASEDV
jgi:O-antigen/teichoic acid export membrane protein